MTGDVKYACVCPTCGKEKLSRKRDVGKNCVDCKNLGWGQSNKGKPSPFYSGGQQAASKRHREKNIDVFPIRMRALIAAANARAKGKGLEGDLTYEQVMSIYPSDGLCPVLGLALGFNSNGRGGDRNCSPSLDRVDNKRGYTLNNVQIISWRANFVRNDSTVEEMEQVLKYMKATKEESQC